jgi:beta-glucanase (GH16 family)
MTEMKSTSTFCFLALLVASAFPTAAVAEDDWKLVWSDEFKGNTLDYSKWGIEVNAFGGGNAELQLYTDRKENVRVADGHLVIEARKNQPNIVGTSRQYSSGRLRTKHRGDWKYGRIEIRAKLPQGQGIWPAIWMLPTDEKYGGWAASGEIDIMELVGHKPNEVLGTLHYGNQWPNNKHTGSSFKLTKGTFADAFHTFTVEWEAGRISWLIDGKLYQTQTKWSTPNDPFPAPFDQRFHLLLNLSVGGRLPGNPNATTKFPQQMLVDYVRVYQRP